MALSLYADVGVVGGDIPSGAVAVDRFHPATIAFRELRGEGDLWVRSRIPMGRGLGFSGAVRVGGAMLAALQHHDDALTSHDVRDEVLRVASQLEGHGDNAAASLLGGVVGTNGMYAAKIINNCALEVVVWIPRFTTSTSESRTKLPAMVPLADAAFNIGHTALLIGALNSGDIDALKAAVADRLHQEVRFRAAEPSKAALDCGVAAGALCGWLSGSGPTVAMFCHAGDGARVAALLPSEGSAKVLGIDDEGVRLL
jgi:homoserine kinase